jgi:hypothetical protein
MVLDTNVCTLVVVCSCVIFEVCCDAVNHLTIRKYACM